MRLLRVPPRPCIFCEIASLIRLQSRSRLTSPIRAARFSDSATLERAPLKQLRIRREGIVRRQPGGGMSIQQKDELRRKVADDSLKFLLEFRNQAQELRIQLDQMELLPKMGVQESLQSWWKAFLTETFPTVYMKGFATGKDARQRETPVLKELRKLYGEQGEMHLVLRLKTMFLDFVLSRHFSERQIEKQIANANLEYPAEWYPRTRAKRRDIHLHVGPTNSGKTYTALKRLEQAKMGIYAGPLRLLAHEVYTRINAAGRPCSLLTGEERRMAPEGQATEIISATVEMVPINVDLDVAVIDEIQMMADSDRGWAWTQAFMGVSAHEVHLCGEERTVDLITQLTALMGDKLTVHRYKRLSPLAVAPESLGGDLSKLQKGDAFVSFSVKGIHTMRKKIEKATGKKVAIVYGSLPPETRAAQARLFNDPNNDYDYLVCSDAIGMGLNLSVKRIVFEATAKYNGRVFSAIDVPHLKQIGGRAGRYRTSHQDLMDRALDTSKPKSEVIEPVDLNATSSKSGLVSDAAVAVSGEAESAAMNQVEIKTNSTESTQGLVTTFDDVDYDYMAEAMLSEPAQIEKARILPPEYIVEKFTQYFPLGTPFSYILTRLSDISKVDRRFELSSLKDQLLICDVIQDVEALSVAERLTFAAAPAKVRDPDDRFFLRALARKVAAHDVCGILDLPALPLQILDEPPSGHPDFLQKLEVLHHRLTLYLWLSYRFAGVFNQRALGFHTKGLVEEAIEYVLTNFHHADEGRSERQRKRREQLYIKEGLSEPKSEEQREEKSKGQDGGASNGAEQPPSSELTEYLKNSEASRSNEVPETPNSMIRTVTSDAGIVRPIHSHDSYRHGTL